MLGLLMVSALAVSSELPPRQPGPEWPAIPPSLESDLTLYQSGGRTVKGADALARMATEADLVVWLAGNQFMAMDAVVAAFQKRWPGTRVGLLTLPSGLLQSAIRSGGLTFRGRRFPGRPDLYGSVSLQHLQGLHAGGFMSHYLIYLHNEIELLVAAGNPKRIRGIDDLARPDVRTSLPNPVDEGIMRFYGRRVLERHGIWNRISGGRDCIGCQTTPNNWFTAAHHRETPERIRRGESDVGMVWKTERLAAERAGEAVAGVSLPPEDALGHEVNYVTGALTGSPHQAAAGRFLDFLATDQAQDLFAGFGFVRASVTERRLRPIP